VIVDSIVIEEGSSSMRDIVDKVQFDAILLYIMLQIQSETVWMQRRRNEKQYYKKINVLSSFCPHLILLISSLQQSLILSVGAILST